MRSCFLHSARGVTALICSPTIIFTSQKKLGYRAAANNLEGANVCNVKKERTASKKETLTRSYVSDE